MSAENDNRLPPRLVPIVGFVSELGAVTFTRPEWRPALARADAEVIDFPNDPREA